MSKIEAIVLLVVLMALLTRAMAAATTSEYSPITNPSKLSRAAAAKSCCSEVGEAPDLVGDAGFDLDVAFENAAVVKSSIEIPSKLAAFLAADGLAN